MVLLLRLHYLRNGMSSCVAQERSMTRRKISCLIGAVMLLILTARTTSAQLEPACVENSPERQGEIGCSIVEVSGCRSGEHRTRSPWDMVAYDDRVKDDRGGR